MSVLIVALESIKMNKDNRTVRTVRLGGLWLKLALKPATCVLLAPSALWKVK
jgi:hypothetical protein